MNLIFKKTTRTILTALIFVLPVTAFSQKLEKPIIDKAANDTTYYTSDERIASDDNPGSTIASYIYCRTKMIKHYYFLHLELDLTLEGHKYFVVPADKKVNIKLLNNSVITLANYSDKVAEQKTIKRGFVQREYESAEMNYNISKEDINKILASDVLTVSIETDEQIVDFTIKPKENEAIKKLLTLILSVK